MATRKVHTGEGEVEYETVICTSCGDEVAKQNCTNVIVGDITDERHWSFGKHKYTFRDDRPAEGWLCEYCHEEPAAYPQNKSSKNKSLIDRLLGR